MKVLFINAEEKKVEAREIGKAYPDGNRLIGADLITTGGYSEDGKNVLFVDDEGLLKPVRYMFRAPDYCPHPLAGNGFICGDTGDGDSTDCELDPSKVLVEFFDLLEYDDYMAMQKYL